MANLWFDVLSVNVDMGYRYFEGGPHESNCEDKSTLYKKLLKEYGRCIGKQYIDTNGKKLAIGWIFLKRDKYSDTKETFLSETWVTVYKSEPKREVIIHAEYA